MPAGILLLWQGRDIQMILYIYTFIKYQDIYFYKVIIY